MSAVGENPFVYPHCWFYDFALFLIKKGLVFADARAKHKSCGRVPFHRQLALRYCHILNAIVLLLQDKCIWGPEQQQLSGGRKVMAVPLRAVLGGREELRARVLVSLVALVSEPSDGGALLHFWEQAKQALSIVSHLALLLNLNVFCLLHIRYSGPYTLVISKPWLRKHYSRSKSLKSLRAVSPFHLYPCIKYERVSPAAQLSAPPVCSPLCNGLISAGVTGEPRRLLIYSWLFKDLFVSWGCCLRWLQAGICERTLGKGKCVHSSQRAPHLQRDCLERFRSPTDVISWNCKCFVFLFYNGNEREKKNEVQPASPSILQNVAEKHFFFFLIIILVGVPCFHGYPLWRSPLLGSALIPGVAGGPQRWDAVVSGRGRMRVSHSDCTASSACLLLLPCPEKGNPVLCSMPSSPPAGFSHTGDTLL